MYRSEIIYFGPPGLEADVFEKTMLNLGYWVDRAEQDVELLGEIGAHPGAITVVATQLSTDGLAELLREIRIRQGASHAPIFVIGGNDHVEETGDGVHFVPASRRLRGTVNGIADYVRRFGQRASLASAQA
ncbi:MAG: hypothetical protein ACM3JD_05695 [Rudaea sp.]